MALLPPARRPAFVVPAPKPLPRLREVSEFAAIRRAVTAQVASMPRAAPVAEVSLRTPEGTTNILQLLGKARLTPSGLWQRVRLAVLSHGTTGWVARSARASPVLRDSRLVINRRRFRATLFRNGMRVFGAPIGVGQGRWPTPAGNFYVRDTLTRYRNATYGPIAFGTGARSATRTDWPAGRYIGIRGTDQPSLIPGPISHGCTRMRSADILRLAKVLAAGALAALGLRLVRLSPISLARAFHSPPRPAPACLGAAFTGPVPRLQPVLVDGGPGPP